MELVTDVLRRGEQVFKEQLGELRDVVTDHLVPVLRRYGREFILKDSGQLGHLMNLTDDKSAHSRYKK